MLGTKWRGRPAWVMIVGWRVLRVAHIARALGSEVGRQMQTIAIRQLRRRHVAWVPWRG